MEIETFAAAVERKRRGRSHKAEKLTAVRVAAIKRTARLHVRMTRAIVAAILPKIVKWIEGCLREGSVPAGEGFPREQVIGALEDKLILSMENGAYEMARQIGELKKAAISLSDWHEVIPQDAVDWIKGYTPQLARVLEEDILLKVRDEVTAGMAQGKTTDEVGASVKAHVSGFAEHRVEAIARTESMRAYNLGGMTTLRQTPDASGVEFCAILDDRTTECCMERDGMRLRMDDPRLIHNTPPLHPNCRSVLIPILGDEVPDDWKGDPEKADLLAMDHPTIQRDVDIEAVRRVWSAGAGKASRFDLQFFGFDPEKERERIRSGYYNLKISPQKQARHTEESKEYERYRDSLEKTAHRGKQGRKPSVLYGGTERAQTILDQYAGSGKIEASREGNAVRETLALPDVAGLAWNRDKKIFEETRWIRIIYSIKYGAHLYPVFAPKGQQGGEGADE